VGSNDDNNDGKHSPIADMAVHFWSCDDRYGSPRVGDLQSKSVQTNDRNDAPSSTTSSKVATPNNQRRDDNFFQSQIVEERNDCHFVYVPYPQKVLWCQGSDVVMLSTNDQMGTSPITIMLSSVITYATHVDKLLSSIQDPLQLSMSGAPIDCIVCRSTMSGSCGCADQSNNG